MEVLTSSPPTPPFSSTTPAPIASKTDSPKSSRSLLDRRQTAAKLLHHQSSQSSPSSSSATASPSLLTASGTHAPFLPSPSASLRMSMLAMASSAASAGVVGRGGVTSGQSSSLPFVPLTPIMASPRLTPDLGAAAGSVVAVANGAAGAGGKQSEQQQRADYLNRGRASGPHYPWDGPASTDGAGRASTMSEHSSTRTTSTGLSEMTNVPRQRSGSSGSTSQTSGGISTTTPGARPSREQPTARLPSSSQHKSKNRRGGKSRSASRTRNTSRTRSASISRPTSPRAIDLGTLPPYQPLPPLSLSPDFRRVEADIAEGLRGMTSLPASSSTTFTSSSNSQPHHASITAGTSRSQSHLVSEAGRSGGMPADGYPHGTQPRAFDESASRVSYGYSHPARSSSSPPSFSPLSASSSSSVVPFPPGIPASTPYAHDPRDADTDSAQTRDSPKHRRSPTRHRPRPGSTNEYQEAVLDQHARYRRAYSQSDDALHHLYQQHSTLPPQAQPHTHSESQSRMPSRERRQRMFKRSFDSFTSKTGTGNFVDPIDVTAERRLRKKSGMLVDENVLDGDMDAGCVLGASLSRKGRSRSVKPKMSLTLSMTSERERAGREESVGSGRGRKMFIVGGDGSDGEGENENEIFVDAEAELGSDDVEVLEDQGERDSRERDERKTARRYHALLELVTTEVGYLQDLRALVSIHLAQLPSLDAPIPSTLSRPSPSTLSISNLGLSRPFPSSRSFLHLPPSSYPQAPGPGPPPSQDTLSPTSATDRHRDAFDGERSRDAESAALAASQKDGNGTVTSKPNRRPLFSEQDVQLITRNAAELLATHETFVKMLKYALEPLGFSDVLSGGFEAKKKMSSEGKEDVENAVKAVTELFCQQASAFEIYESFCPGHNEATDLIRTVQEQHPVEWDAFEQRCSLRVSHAFDQQGTPSMDTLRGSLKSKRRHSLSSLAMPMTLSPFGAVSSIPVPLSATGPAKSDTLANRHKRKGSGDVPPSSATTPGNSNSNSQAGRLKFLDYLIKPVQRICKYPLLLDQLKLKRSEADASQLWDEDPVEAAASAMRRVVALVDRASEKRAHAIKSNLIASRLLADCPASPTSPVHVTVDDRRTQLSAEFMQSLGACMLAGALDVVYYQSNGSCRAKYLATFLYVGGYLVLAKVPKGGKAYEAKHWFPLAGFEIVDQEDEEALPYTFHLCSPTAQIHFAASCQLEKTIWMTAIQESLSIMPSAWVNEPTINLPTDIRPLVFAAPEDVIGSEWAATPLPTIQSMSELETPAESSNGPAPPTSSPRKIPKTIARAESLIIQQNHDLVKLSRRTSTTSVKAFFAPLTFDSRVTRPSGQIRQQVDNGLHDVLSDTFVAVRSQVLMRDEELFQLRKKPGNVSRSNSALSISGAFSTRRRRDSATLTSRRKSSVDGPPDFTTDLEAAAKATNLMLARRSKSSSAKLKRQRLSLLPSSAPPLPHKMDSDENMPVVERSQSPSPLTRGPSAASSNTNSILPSPVELTMPLPTPGSSYSRSPDSRRAERPKRTTSMVDNFKYFFQSRSTSPTPSYQRSPQVSVINLDVESETHGGLIQWWRRGSIRRRAQSYPEAATDESAPVTPAASSDDSSHAELKAITDRDLLTASPTMLSADGRHRHVSFSQNRTTLARRRSLFASTTFASTTRLDQPASLGTSNMPQIYRSKTLKNLFSFQRSPSHSGELSHQPT